MERDDKIRLILSKGYARHILGTKMSIHGPDIIPSDRFLSKRKKLNPNRLINKLERSF